MMGGRRLGRGSIGRESMAQGGIWPPHCVKGTVGFELTAALRFPATAVISDKPYFRDLETYDGFNFRSLRSLYKQPVYNTYTYQQKNLDQTMEQKYDTVIDYEFMKTFNSLEDTNAGTFSNRLISLNILNRTQKVTDFDYDKYKASSPPMNGKNNGVTIDNTNRFGLKSTQNPLEK